MTFRKALRVRGNFIQLPMIMVNLLLTGCGQTWPRGGFPIRFAAPEHL
jgi:hypothetical protein